MCTERPKELKRLQKENQRLYRGVSDPTLDKLILTEAAEAALAESEGSGATPPSSKDPCQSIEQSDPEGPWATVLASA